MQRKKAVNNPFKTEDFAVGSKGSNVSKKERKFCLHKNYS